MIRSGESRRQIARTLKRAYASGLLSQETFTIRTEDLLSRRLIDPGSLIGDLSFRALSGWRATLAELRADWATWWADRRGERELLLALDCPATRVSS